MSFTKAGIRNKRYLKRLYTGMKLTKAQLLQKFQDNPELKFEDLPEESCTEDFFNEVKAEFANQPIEEIESGPLAKNLGQLVRKEFEVKIKELENGHLQAIVNSGQEDRHGEVLDMKGLDIKSYMKNPILANGHDYSKYSVGRTWKLVKTRVGELIAEFTFATDIDEYKDPKILDALYRKGYQFAFSIGFIPKKISGNVYTESEMIEFSPVLIGADKRALLKSKDFIKKELGIDLVSKELGKIPSLKGGENMKLTKKQIKDMLKGNPELKYDEVKDVADEDVFNDAKAELEAESKAAAAKGDLEKKVDDLNKSVNDLAEKLKAADKPVAKDINDSNPAPKGNDFNVNKGEKPKEVKFQLYVRGLVSGNYKEYIDAVGKDAMNTGDTSVVLPPAEFIAEVERLEEEVGIARRFATVRRSDRGKGVTFHKGADDVEIFETAEAGSKKSTKLSYTDYLLEWRKFAAILPITDELLEDSAIPLWNDATQRFARAYARKEDFLVFLEPSNTGVKNKGILYETGTNQVIVDNGITGLTYDNFVDMIFGVPSESARNGRFYLHRTAVGASMKIKDSHGDPIWQKAMADGTPATILGKPYSIIDDLPGVTDEAADLPFMAFGDLRYVTLGERTDLRIKVFDSGVVGDPDEEDQEANTLNLLTQDLQAMRAVKRFNAVVRHPEAFSVAVLTDDLS